MKQTNFISFLCQFFFPAIDYETYRNCTPPKICSLLPIISPSFKITKKQLQATVAAATALAPTTTVANSAVSTSSLFFFLSFYFSLFPFFFVKNPIQTPNKRSCSEEKSKSGTFSITFLSQRKVKKGLSEYLGKAKLG